MGTLSSITRGREPPYLDRAAPPLTRTVASASPERREGDQRDLGDAQVAIRPGRRARRSRQGRPLPNRPPSGNRTGRTQADDHSRRDLLRRESRGEFAPQPSMEGHGVNDDRPTAEQAPPGLAISVPEARASHDTPHAAQHQSRQKHPQRNVEPQDEIRVRPDIRRGVPQVRPVDDPSRSRRHFE
jgi:hypothetical protein